MTVRARLGRAYATLSLALAGIVLGTMAVLGANVLLAGVMMYFVAAVRSRLVQVGGCALALAAVGVGSLVMLRTAG